MDMDIIQLILSYLKPELLIVLAACYVVGMFLKSLPMVKDWLIPLLVLAFGVLFTILYIAVVLGSGFTAKAIVEGFMQGLLCAALAVYGNQFIKQLGKRGTE